jgi:hypothetical protein
MKHATTSCALILAGLALSAGLAAKPVPPPAEPLPGLVPVLGKTADAWTLTDRGTRPPRYVVRETNGVAALIPEVVLLNMVGSFEVKPGSEVTALVLLGNEGAASSFKMTGGLTGSTNKAEGYSLALSAAAGLDNASVIFKTVAQGARESLAKCDYKMRWLTKRNLGLPEPIRLRIEHLMATQPPLTRSWLQVRWQVRADGTRVYVDDRLVWDGGSNTAGRFSLDLGKTAALASFRVEPLPAQAPGFEPIALDRYLNSGRLDGARLKSAGLPAPGALAAVGGVPFLAPRPDPAGNDHVDLEPSWLQNGFLGGRDSPRDGAFGGRWAGAWSRNPTRLQFTIPQGRYSAIHLLAAADSEPDSLPIVTAQFFIPEAGRPIQTVPATVRRFSAAPGEAPSLRAILENGKAGSLFLVTIPVEPGSLASFRRVELELTKGVRLYRAWPDPMYYSMHPAGLPSSVHVYALTLERPPVSVDLKASNGLHVWTAPEKPSYTAVVTPLRPVGPVSLELSTRSYDGQETTRQVKKVEFKDGKPETVTFELGLKKHGHHDVTLTLGTGTVFQTETRALALLHPDTREKQEWERGHGPIFGFWNWRGGHDTPPEPLPTRIMGLAGAEADHASFDERVSEEGKQAAREQGIRGYKAFGAGDHYVTANFSGDLQKLGYEAAKSNFLATLAERYIERDDLNRPMFISFYAEPSIGLHTPGVPLSYDGLPRTNDYVFTADEEARFQLFLKGFVEGAKIVKAAYPGVKCLLPHGDPGFPVPFLRRSEEARKLIDGVTVDVPVFERLPESQFHQVALHRLVLCRDAFREAGNPDPWLPMYEGPCLPARPGSLNRDEHAALSVRNSLILLAHGVDFQTGGWCPFDAGSYWGEQHYGGGICDPLPLATPKPSFSAFASMTRNLNRCNFVKGVPTGSTATYAMQFKHYKTGALVHAFWTIRGTRPCTVAVPAGAAVAVYDSMDNRTDVPVRDGSVTFTLGQAPCYVYGLPESPVITLGEADHSDAAPAAGALPLAQPGDGSWTVSAERDLDYEDSFKAFIRRYPSPMTVRAVEAPADKGGKALAVHLEKPAREVRTMPFYATLTPARPIPIPGKGSHLGLWVKAAGDWGRVVYSVRDAKGERWLSVGTKGAWNCDDIHQWSVFNFDGWRYLRFELPACSPYDLFREAGSTWWGSYGAGDRVPDLPLTLEKILVERRTHAITVTEFEAVPAGDVELGALYAEYEKPEDRTGEAIRLAGLRMPVPEGVPEMDNPIAELTASAAGKALAITNISIPLQESDGTQCYVHFTTTPEAAEYEIWGSPYPDGRGAVKVGEKLKGSGVRVRGFRPDTDFYLYAVWRDAKGAASKPSAPYKINLKDTFAMK